MNKSTLWWYFGTVEVSRSPESFYPMVLASIHESYLSQALRWGFQMMIFWCYHFSLYLLLPFSHPYHNDPSTCLLSWVSLWIQGHFFAQCTIIHYCHLLFQTITSLTSGSIFKCSDWSEFQLMYLLSFHTTFSVKCSLLGVLGVLFTYSPIVCCL